MASYDFRIRARFGDTVQIMSDNVELVVYDTDSKKVVLKSMDGEESLSNARDFVIRGYGYQSSDDAEVAAQNWHDHIVKAFSALRIGADFERGKNVGGLTSEAFGVMMAAVTEEVQLYNDTPGIAVFPHEPTPYFFRGEATGRMGVPVDFVLKTIEQAVKHDLRFTGRLLLAYDLYSLSFFQKTPDARFMMLSMAMETIIQQAERPAEVLGVVDQLADLVRASTLSMEQRQPLLSSIKSLREESVGQAGRRVAANLGDRIYQEKPAVKFFSYCYSLRSKLVHGHYPRPSYEAVNIAAANYELFVGNLLGLELL